MTERDRQLEGYVKDQKEIYLRYLKSFERFFTYLIDSGTTVPYEEFTTDWPEPPQENLFEDTNISATYLEQIALAMRNQNIKGASYVEDIASQLRDLGDEYVGVVKQRDEALNRLPDGMRHCTIVFKQCPQGHGRLTTTNWIQYDCDICEIERLRDRITKLEVKMIELRYNKDGKLEYRTRILGYIAEGISDGWNEWKIVPSETKGYTSSIEEERRERDELKLRVGILEYIHDDPLRHRKECSEVAAKYCREATKEREQHAKTKARVVELEAEKKTLLESEMWGVNCKPSASDAAGTEASNG